MNIFQRRALFGFLFCALSSASASGQAASPSIAGDYPGLLDHLHVVLHLTQDSSGALSGKLDSIDQKAAVLSCAHVTLSGKQLSFDIPAVHGSYKGEFGIDGNTINGTWTQGSSIVLNFTRQATAAAPAKEMGTKDTFNFAGKSRTLYTLVPQAEGLLPLLVLLHGSGGRGQGMIHAWAALASKENFILAAPDAFDSAAWNIFTETPDFFDKVIEQVKAKHAVDESRVYLFGHSGGAVYALFLALLDSHSFAAISLHAGALRPDYYKFFAYAERRMPIGIWVGDRDPFFPVEQVAATKKEFESKGFPVELTIIPFHDHFYDAVSDEVNGKAWAFLKRARLSQPETTVQH